MINPYDPPSNSARRADIEAKMQGPAIALIVVASISLVFCLLGLAIDVALLVSGMVEELEKLNKGPVPQSMKMLVRSIWTVVLINASAFILYGAIQMKNLRKYSFARAATVVAMVPCIGPCCILGIPVGIWAFSVINKPGIEESFQ